jgi:hypothetical protein
MSTTLEAPTTDGMRRWWIGDGGKVAGPYGAPYILVGVKTGKLLPTTPACLVGTQEWRSVADWAEFGSIVKPVPASAATQKRSTSLVPYADFWDRVRALFLDGVIVFVGAEISSRVWGSVYGDIRTNDSAYSLFLLMAAWMYFAAFESSGWQATPGKKALGIKVTDLNGDRISFGRATLRYFGKGLSSLVLIGWFLAAEEAGAT